MRYKSGDLCVIHSKTSSYNGKVVEVVNYTKGKCKDILLVKIRSHQGRFFKNCFEIRYYPEFIGQTVKKIVKLTMQLLGMNPMQNGA